MMSIPTLYDMDAVLALLPPTVKVSKRDAEAYIREKGIYRNMFGKTVLTGDDVVDLFDAMRAEPRGGLNVTRGPLRVLEDFPDGQPGYLVFLVDPIDPHAPLYIGFAPDDVDGMRDLLLVVEEGYPGDLDIVCPTRVTFGECKKFREAFAHHNFKGNWYIRGEDLNDKIGELRRRVYPDDDVANDTEETGP